MGLACTANNTYTPGEANVIHKNENEQEILVSRVDVLQK